MSSLPTTTTVPSAGSLYWLTTWAIISGGNGLLLLLLLLPPPLVDPPELQRAHDAAVKQPRSMSLPSALAHGRGGCVLRPLPCVL
jgi:hypothetical protein